MCNNDAAIHTALLFDFLGLPFNAGYWLIYCQYLKSGKYSSVFFHELLTYSATKLCSYKGWIIIINWLPKMFKFLGSGQSSTVCSQIFKLLVYPKVWPQVSGYISEECV